MLPRFVPLNLLMALSWCLGPALGHELPPVEVVGQLDMGLGATEAASQGGVEARQISERAWLRPAEVLESIPGMVVTQHSGDGKANQYFLRGMNLDHGTDFATTVNGVPVNLPSHAHGQGYSDLNFLIPELVSRVTYRKGPYAAVDGDFSSAGSADFVYRTRLERPMADVTVGQRGYLRSVVAGSTEVTEGVSMLMALERMNHDGPWTVPEGLGKSNALLVLSGGTPREGWRGTLSAYAAHWRSTDQVPQRLLDAGLYQGQAFGRFDSLDPSDGASSRRTSLSAAWHRRSDQESSQLDVYAIRYALSVFSNFTYSLARPTDQFAQTDDRTVLGGRASHTWFSAPGQGPAWQNTLGLQWRQDHARLGLYDSASRQLLATVRDDDVHQTLLGVYGENETRWTPWLRTVSGMRVDPWRARVSSLTQWQNSGASRASLVSPKVSFILGPWARTEFFVNAGRGFHSNDARGTTARVDPRTLALLEAVPGLVATRGQEIGLKSLVLADLQTSVALWRLDLDSELVYVGDAGSTTASRPSRRTGLEWSNQWTPGRHWRFDLNLAWTRPRYADGEGALASIPNAVQKVAHLSVALRSMGPWSGALSLRYLGAAPLKEDNSVRSAASTTLNLRVLRQMSDSLDLALDVLNLSDRSNNDMSYVYTSRLAGEPAAGVEGLHVHPAEPRSLRLTARLRF